MGLAVGLGALAKVEFSYPCQVLDYYFSIFQAIGWSLYELSDHKSYYLYVRLVYFLVVF